MPLTSLVLFAMVLSARWSRFSPCSRCKLLLSPTTVAQCLRNRFN